MSARTKTSGRWALCLVVVTITATLSCLAFPALAQQPANPQLPGSISGSVVDHAGKLVAGAQVTLSHGEQLPKQVVISDDDGEYLFSNVAPGPFLLTVSSPAFATQTYSGTLAAAQHLVVPPITITLATVETEVHVGVTRTEIAEDQVKIQEKQRVLKVIPNFYVTYTPNAVPMTPKLKFALAWKTTMDPVSFVVIGAIAGVQQAQNDFSGYGQGAEGYGKRYGASFADLAIGTFMGSAILPALLKQDPRYFYKGTGGKGRRILYALANSVIAKGDNGRWQPNYSNVLGNLAAGGISNLYYPSQNRNGVGLTFENTGIGIGTTAVINVIQEFFVRKFTPSARNQDAAKVQPATH